MNINEGLPNNSISVSNVRLFLWHKKKHDTALFNPVKYQIRCFIIFSFFSSVSSNVKDLMRKVTRCSLNVNMGKGKKNINNNRYW